MTQWKRMAILGTLQFVVWMFSVTLPPPMGLRCKTCTECSIEPVSRICVQRL